MKKSNVVRVLTLVLVGIISTFVVSNTVFAVEYTSVSNATDLKTAIVAGESVKLTSDIILTEPITITENNVTIDLNGKTLSYDSSVAGEALITNKGSLTITDSTDSAQGKILFKYVGEPDSAYGKGNYTISNVGTLVIEKGTIENATAKMKHACYAIDNNSNNSAANLTVNGGTIINTNNYALRQVVGSKENNATINGGTVTGTRAVWVQLAGSDKKVKTNVSLNVNGGKLIATGEDGGYKLAVYSYTYGNSLENVKINVSGGTLEGDIALTGGKNKDISELVNITGGRITDVYSYAAADVTRIEIAGGIFDYDLSDYLASSVKATATLTKDDEELYAVGENNIKELASTATAGNVIEIDGDVDLTNMNAGVVVKATANSKVTANGISVPEEGITIKAEVKVETPELDPTDKVEEVKVGVTDTDKITNVFVESLKQKAEAEGNEEFADIVANNHIEIAVDISSVEEELIDEEVKTAMNEAADGATISTFFDITLAVMNTTSGDVVGELEELTEEIELMILLPEELKNTNDKVNRNYYIIRRHVTANGVEIEKIKTTLSEDGNSLSFKTDKFSTYALAYEDTESLTDNPKTSDNIISYLIMVSISIIGVFATITRLKSKKLFN